MSGPVILFLKSVVKGHVRRGAKGGAVYVQPYTNKVQPSGDQGDLFSPGVVRRVAEQAPPAPAAPATPPARRGEMDSAQRAELRSLYREAVHGAGAEPRRAARAKIAAMLEAAGVQMRDAFEANNLDMAAFFASRPIG